MAIPTYGCILITAGVSIVTWYAGIHQGAKITMAAILRYPDLRDQTKRAILAWMRDGGLKK